MGIEVDSAIIAIYDASNLPALIAGGIWDSVAPVRTPFPYLIFEQISTAPDVWTSGGIPNSRRGEIREELFQLSIYVKENNITDPKAAVGQLMEAVRTVYDNTKNTMLAIGRQILLRRTAGEIVTRESSGIYKGVLTYRFRSKIETGGGRL